jgi:hypothetical protein
MIQHNNAAKRKDQRNEAILIRVENSKKSKSAYWAVGRIIFCIICE